MFFLQHNLNFYSFFYPEPVYSFSTIPNIIKSNSQITYFVCQYIEHVKKEKDFFHSSKMIRPYEKFGRNMTFEEVKEWMPKIEAAGVSKVALKEFNKEFLDNKGDWSKIDPKLLQKRVYFLNRQVALYINKPSYKRMLSLITWAFLPNHQVEKNFKAKKPKLNTYMRIEQEQKQEDIGK